MRFAIWFIVGGILLVSGKIDFVGFALTVLVGFVAEIESHLESISKSLRKE
jgi:hypothetical protein